MTNLAWLAAVLSPFEIAPNPNFGAAPGFRPEADLASVVSGDQPSWDSIERRIGIDKASPEEATDDGVRGVYAALYEGLDSAASVALLRQLESTIMDSDGARRAALTLVMCFVAGANDRYDQCELLLRRALDALDGDDAETLLCRAALLQQLAFRKVDAGQLAEQDSISAAVILDEISTASFNDFALNGVSPLSSQDVVERIRLALVRATWSTVRLEPFDPNGRGPIPSRRDQLFSSRADRFSQIKNDELVEYGRLIEKSFDDVFRRASQTTMGYRPPDLFFELLAYENYGHAGASHVRKQLAMMRLTRTFPSFQGTNVGDCLRLFRHSGAEAELRKVIDNILYGGPLEAIVEDARRILNERNRPEEIRVVELVVLEAAADLLTTAETASILELIFELIEAGGPQDLPGQWQIDSKQSETMWDAAIAVGGASGSVGRAAERILESASMERMSDEMWDRAYARAIRQIGWQSVPDEVLRAWSQFLATDGLQDKFVSRAFHEKVRQKQRLQ